jgi:homogentisate 1,2-dioxygenase
VCRNIRGRGGLQLPASAAQGRHSDAAHPRGIHHGPHPKALANQGKKTFTDESAVMLDGLNPIDVLPAGENVECKEYWMSWMEKK